MSDEARTKIKHTLASVAAFQTFAGAGDYAAALLKIHKYWLPAPANAGDAYELSEMQSYRPFAAFFAAEGDEQTTTFECSAGGGFSALQSGMLKMELQRDMTTAEQAAPLEAVENFAGEIRSICEGFCLLANTGGHALIQRVMADRPSISKVDVAPTQGGFVCATLSFDWGVGGLSA